MTYTGCPIESFELDYFINCNSFQRIFQKETYSVSRIISYNGHKLFQVNVLLRFQGNLGFF